MPVVLAACASSPEQAPVTAHAADITQLKQEIARRDEDIERLERNLTDLRRDLETLQTQIVIPAKAGIQEVTLDSRFRGDDNEKAVTDRPEPAPAPAKPQETTAPAAPEGEFAIHLASYGSAALAAEGWTKLALRHPDLVAGLEPRLTTLNIDNAIYHRLIAGRFNSHDDARRACGRLKPATGYCVVTFYGGDALP